MADDFGVFAATSSNLSCDLSVMTDKRIYLASQSPRRAELLEQIGVRFEVVNIDVDETTEAGEAAENYVLRLAMAKAHAGWQYLKRNDLPLKPVLGADTSVVLGARIMGKPRDQEHAMEMLDLLSGHTHQVMSAVCFCYGDFQHSALSVTAVSFRDISKQELIDYWHSGEPLGKAGAYAIQGLGAVFVERIEGSYSGVVGLPLLETHQLLLQIEKNIMSAGQ